MKSIFERKILPVLGFPINLTIDLVKFTKTLRLNNLTQFLVEIN